VGGYEKKVQKNGLLIYQIKNWEKMTPFFVFFRGFVKKVEKGVNFRLRNFKKVVTFLAEILHVGPYVFFYMWEPMCFDSHPHLNF
jgi:hypothetical protein